jgi:hypothetical protein
MDAEQIIRVFDMKPLPEEGGFYTETYRSGRKVSPDALEQGYEGPRCLSTAILYLITPETFSAMHRIKSDEIFHFYRGDPVKMLQLYPDGTGAVFELGTDIEDGQLPQVVVPRGTWQGCFVEPPGQFALLGTTVNPGFEFEDFEAANTAELIKEWPQYEKLIRKLSRQNQPNKKSS